MGEIARWGGHVFEVTPQIVRSLNTLTVKAGIETDDMEADKQRRKLSPYLFTDEQGQLIHPDTFTKRLRKIYDAIGFPREYHLHTLRHYFVTSLLHCGVDKQTVADLVGHADTGFLERTYCHPQQAQKEQAADSMLTMLRPDGEQIFNLAACSPKRRSA